jgi:hypothetical protein
MVLQRRLSRRFSLKAPSDRDDRGWTPLHVAARRGDLAEVGVSMHAICIESVYVAIVLVNNSGGISSIEHEDKAV